MWLAVAKDNSGVLCAKSVKLASMENALCMWFSDVRAHSLCVSDNIVIKKGKTFCDELSVTNFLYSRGWLRGFNKRHGIRLHKAHGEADSVSTTIIQSGREQDQQDIGGYAPKDIYNMEETGNETRRWQLHLWQGRRNQRTD